METFNSGSVAADGTARRSVAISNTLSAKIVAAAVAILLGVATLFVAGFSGNDFVHAAAHDVRHAIGFPCH